MYKVFFGSKCIELGSATNEASSAGGFSVQLSSARQLHSDYLRFIKDKKRNTMQITGDPEQAWLIFRSLFFYIEAAGGLVRNSNGHLLMIYRNRHWDLPKGKLENGEIARTAAIREVEEECSISQLSILRELPFTHHAFVQKGKHCLKRTYWFEMESKDEKKPVPQKEEGIQKAEWIERKRMPEVEARVYDSLKEILKYF